MLNYREKNCVPNNPCRIHIQKQKEKKTIVYLQSISVSLQNNIKITIKYFFFQSENEGGRKDTDLLTLFWKQTEKKNVLREPDSMSNR